MPYIDDWGTTYSGDIKDLQRECADPVCSHMRYRHGFARRVRGAGVSHTPGVCEQCRCKAFSEVAPITRDEIIDAHQVFKFDDARLSDFGIDPLPPEKTPDAPEAW